VGVALDYGELPKIWGFPFNIYALAEASDIRIGMRLRFQRSIIKSHPEEKVGVSWARRASQNLGVSL